MKGVNHAGNGWLAGVLAALLTGGLVGSARAQSASGSIEGTVVDQSRAVLPGVTITLLQSALAADRTVVSDENGVFRAPLLPVGVYELTATLAGFEPAKHTDMRLTVGRTITLRIDMRVAGVAETVDVSVVTPVLETTRSHVTSTVEEAAVRNLPVNGRNFIEFALLTPGVTRDVRSGDLSFAGQRGTLNSLIVDGADNNNTFAGQTLGRTGSGRAPYQFSLEAVKEFQVNSNAFSAEYGRAGGAVINVVTRSGTQTFTGSVFEFYRDKALNATDPIAGLNNQPKGPYHHHQFGAALGGPLRMKRTKQDVFFLNYDGQRNTQSNDVFLDVRTAPDDAATRAAIERLRPLASSWERRLDQDVFLVRTDHRFGSTGRITVRYNRQAFTGEGYEAVGPRQSFEHTGTSVVNTRTLNATWSAVFRNRTFNELRMQTARDQARGMANSDDPEAVILQSGMPVLFIGRNNFSPRETTIDRVQVADTLMWARGAHRLKTGFDVQFDRIENFFPGFFSGSYTFGSLAAFERKEPTSYQQSFPGAGTSGPRSRPDVREYAVFLQDDWRAAPDITLNFGLRYDLMKTAPPSVRNSDPQLLAAGIDTSRLEPDRNNWGPRLGIVWGPDRRPYVLRGGWGLFYGRTPALMLVTTHTNNGVSIVSMRFTGDAVPAYPQTFAAIPPGIAARPTIFYVDRNFANPRLMQANAAVEWELARDTSVTATYLFVDGSHLPRAIDRNLGSLGERTFTVAGSGEAISYPYFGPDRPFTNFQRVIALESSAASRYNGLTLELNRRFARGMHFRVAYTLGKVVDTVPDATAVLPGNGTDDAKYASNPRDFDVDRTAGNNDQRHRVVVSGVYMTNRHAGRLGGVARALASGWSVSAILTAQSGQPFSARVGNNDLNNDGNTRNDLAPGTRRNGFRLPAIVTVDSRIARDIPVAGRVRAQVIWEAFNLSNRANINAVTAARYTVDGTTLTPATDFGRPVSGTGERIMQLAVRMTF